MGDVSGMKCILLQYIVRLRIRSVCYVCVLIIMSVRAI